MKYINIALFYSTCLINNLPLFYRKFKRTLLNCFFLLTLDKIIGLIVGVLIMAILKYIISGGFSINWNEFNLNVTLGICGGIIRIFVKESLNEYLNIKGTNYSLYQLLYGLEKQKLGYSGDLADFKPKLYNSMDSHGESSKGDYLDKGKGVAIDPDRMSLDGSSDNESTEPYKNPYLEGEGLSPKDNTDNPTKLDKGKGIDRFSHPNHPSFQNEAGPSSSIFIPNFL